MLGNRPMSEWISQYELSHQNTVNRLCHTIGIPLVAGSILLFLISIVAPAVWPVAVTLFIIGWVFQFIGHAFERKPPEFFRDWRFLFVGLRWWFVKMAGRL